jgi:hypothetical protein
VAQSNAGHENVKIELHGGPMTIQKFALLAVAAVLSGCASTNSPGETASVQQAVYVVSDATSAIPVSDGAAVKSEGRPTSAVPGETPGAPKGMRIYWFLGGR